MGFWGRGRAPQPAVRPPVANFHILRACCSMGWCPFSAARIPTRYARAHPSALCPSHPQQPQVAEDEQLLCIRPTGISPEEHRPLPQPLMPYQGLEDGQAGQEGEQAGEEAGPPPAPWQVAAAARTGSGGSKASARAARWRESLGTPPAGQAAHAWVALPAAVKRPEAAGFVQGPSCELAKPMRITQGECVCAWEGGGTFCWQGWYGHHQVVLVRGWAHAPHSQCAQPLAPIARSRIPYHRLNSLGSLGSLNASLPLQLPPWHALSHSTHWAR